MILHQKFRMLNQKNGLFNEKNSDFESSNSDFASKKNLNQKFMIFNLQISNLDPFFSGLQIKKHAVYISHFFSQNWRWGSIPSSRSTALATPPQMTWRWNSRRCQSSCHPSRLSLFLCCKLQVQICHCVRLCAEETIGTVKNHKAAQPKKTIPKASYKKLHKNTKAYTSDHQLDIGQ